MTLRFNIINSIKTFNFIIDFEENEGIKQINRSKKNKICFFFICLYIIFFEFKIKNRQRCGDKFSVFRFKIQLNVKSARLAVEHDERFIRSQPTIPLSDEKLLRRHTHTSGNILFFFIINWNFISREYRIVDAGIKHYAGI